MANDPKYRAWNQLFDRMAVQAEEFKENKNNTDIYEIVPRSWERRDLLQHPDSLTAIVSYNTAVYMNLRIQDNIKQLYQSGYPNSLPDLFHATDPEYLDRILIEGKLRTRNGRLWFSGVPEYDYGSCGVAINSAAVNITGGFDGGVVSDWLYTDQDVVFDPTINIIFAKTIPDAIELHMILNVDSFKYNILTIGLLGVKEFDQFCVKYNRMKYF